MHHSQRGKKIIACLLCAALLLGLFAACGKSGDSGLIIDYSDFSYDPPKTVTPTYSLSENPIEISYSSKNNGGYAIISGLKDLTVQDRINRAIKDEYERLGAADFLPPVTGIRVLEKKYEGKPSESGVYCGYDFNSENLLCIVFSYWKNYGSWEDREDTIYGIDSVQYRTFLTFDLSTGKKLKLEDLFLDGVDPVKYINSAIAKMIANSDISSEQGGWGSVDQGIRISGEFKGIASDQPFYLSSDGMLGIYLDGRNTEFALNLVDSIEIDFYKVSAISKRYGDKSGLYEKAVSRWHLVDRPFAEGGIIPVDIPGTSRISSYDPDEWEGESMEFLSRVQSYDGLSDGVNKYLSLEWLNPSKLIASAKGRAAVYAREDESAYGRFEVYSYADRCGAYINTVCGWSEAHYSGWEGTVYYDEGFQEMACFKEGSDEPLKLEDLFWKGDLAKEYLRNAQMESCRRDSATFYKSNYNILVRLTQELTDHISGFNVQRNYLIVEYDTDISAIILKHFPKAGNNYRATLLSDTGYFDYSSIGYDNLRIFK